jgi:hypothetical protein
MMTKKLSSCRLAPPHAFSFPHPSLEASLAPGPASEFASTGIGQA